MLLEKNKLLKDHKQVLNASKQLEQHIQPAREAIKQQLHQTPLLNSDETGLRVEGKLYGLHSASTDKLITDYEVHEKRGKEGIDAAGILEGYQGKLVHDHWKTYFSYDKCEHIACNAHHLRELIYIEKQYQQMWTGEMATLLVEIKNAVDAARPEKNHLSQEQLRVFEQRYDTLVSKGFEKNPFVPSEVIEGCAKQFASIRGYISTTCKNSVSIFTAIKDAFSGNPFIPSPQL